MAIAGTPEVSIAPQTESTPESVESPRQVARSALTAGLRDAEVRTLAELKRTRVLLRQAVDAAVACDAGRARDVTETASESDHIYEDVHERLMAVIATQAPVASDLRLAMALVHVNERVERMCSQCVNIATLCTEIGGNRPSDAQLSCLDAMAHLAEEQISEAARIFAERDLEGLAKIRKHDSEINERNRSCFGLAIDEGRDDARREAAFFVALMARAIERIGDNAVDIAQQANFAATGRLRIATGS